jgi:hypothetical protein
MDKKETTIIEINGVKLEVDLRHAKRIDELTIGSPVKCLVKRYDSYSVYPGIIVGFEPFLALPTIVVAYLETDSSIADIKFRAFNTNTKDFEMVPDVDYISLALNKEEALARFDRQISQKEGEIKEIQQKKDFFLGNFGKYFTEL